MKNNQIFLLLVVIGVVLRLLPHPSNVAPISALAIVSILFLKSKNALVVPLIVSLVTDLFLGFHSTIGWVYGSYALIFALGWMTRNHISFKTIVPLSLISSSTFFLVTNFGVWISTNMYTKNFQGLMESYIMGLPFLRNTVIGDLFFTVTLFSLYTLYTERKFFLQQTRNVQSLAIKS